MSKRAHDKSCTLNGMPCHKYIIRNLTTEKDMLEFERAYADLMLSKDYNENEIEDALIAMSSYINPKSPLQGKVFDILGNGPDMGNFVSSLIFDNNIPTYGKCSAYYKRFDKQIHACSLCEFSAKSTCTNIKNEKLLLRFILESNHNYEAALSSGASEDFFNSNIDIMAYTNAGRSYPLQLYKLIFSLLGDETVRAEHYEKEHLGDGIRNGICARLKKMRLPSEFHTESFFYKVIDVLEYDIYKSELIAPERAEALLNSPVTENKKEDVPISDTAPSFFETLNPFMHEVKQNSGNVPEPDLSSEKKSLDAQEQIDKIPNEETPVEDKIVSNTRKEEKKPDENLKIDNKADPLPDPAERKPSPEATADNENLSSGKNQEPEVCKIQTGKEESKEQNPDHPADQPKESENHRYKISTISADKLEVEDVIPAAVADIEPYIILENTYPDQFGSIQMDMGDDLIYYPDLEYKELLAAGICLDTRNAAILSKFENAILHDKCVSIECVEADHAPYVLFWVSMLNTFFFTDCKHGFSFEIVKKILASNLIRKIIYSPFRLYAMCKELGVYIKNVASLQCRHYALGKNETDYLSVMRSYRIDFYTPGVDFRCEGELTSEVFPILPSYSKIFRKQKRLLKKREKEEACKEIEDFCAAIGNSYRSPYLPLKGRDTIVTMPRPLIFSFYPNTKEAYIPGYILMYKVDGCNTKNLLREMICELNKGGLFRNYPVQLLSFSDKSIYLFVGENEFEYMTTLIPSIIHTKSCGKMVSLNTAYKYIPQCGKAKSLQNADITKPSAKEETPKVKPADTPADENPIRSTPKPAEVKETKSPEQTDNIVEQKPEDDLAEQHDKMDTETSQDNSEKIKSEESSPQSQPVKKKEVLPKDCAITRPYNNDDTGTYKVINVSILSGEIKNVSVIGKDGNLFTGAGAQLPY